MQLATRPVVAATVRNWPRRLAIALAAVVALLVIAWLAVPPIVKGQLETRLTEALGRTTTIEAVAFDPFRLRLTLRNFAIASRDAGPPLLALDELVADVSAASLWHRAPVLDAIRATRPRVSLARDRDGRYSIQDLLDAAAADPPGPPPAFSLNNIEIDDGSVAFDDAAAGAKHALTGLHVAVPFVSSLPYETDIKVTPRFEGSINGSRLALAGSTTPFATRREATLDVDLDGISLPQYVGYLPSRPRFSLASGALTTRLKVVFVEGAGERALEIRGNAQLDGLAVKRLDGSPLVAADRIAVVLDRIAMPAAEARVTSLTIDAPSVDLKRMADGRLELAGPLLEAPPKSAAAPATTASGPPWTVFVGALDVARGKLALADEGSTFRSTLVDVALAATNLSTRRGDKAHVKLSFVSDDRIASFAGEADVEPMVPAASGRFELTKFSLGLLFPYYKDVLVVDVRKGSLDLASHFALDAAGNLKLSEGVASIANLELALPKRRDLLWRVPSLAAGGVDVDLDARKLTIGEVQGRGAVLSLVRERDGTLEMSRFLKPAPAGGPAGGPDWTVAAKKTVLEKITINFEDRVPDPAVKLAIRDLSATVTDATNVRGARSPLVLRARIGDRGQLAFRGPVGIRPVSLAGTLDTSGLALTPIKPYVEPHINVVVTGGVLAAKGALRLDVPDSGQTRAAWKGDVAVEGFSSIDKPTASDLARWKKLSIEGLDVTSSPFRASAGRIGFDDFYARVIVYPDATLNLARLLTPGESAEPTPGAKPPPPPAETKAAREALPLSIGRIELNRGNVNFTDLFVRPNYSANLTDVNGSVSTLSADLAGDVSVNARVDGTAPVEVRGRINPFASELSLDLAGKARDIDLPAFTPYSVKYAGYGIEKGKLTFDVHYRVDNRKLAAENRLVLDQLTFGERVESPTATKLPVLLAVALLKDANGVIDIQLPISGSLDDPKFSVGGLIIQVIINLITKAVTAPFALLSAVFGGGEELSTVSFAAGSAAIGPEAEKRIDTLAKALAGRPGLKLDIGGRADPQADRDALRRDAVETSLRREKLKVLAAKGEAPASTSEVTIAADERARWVTAAWRTVPRAKDAPKKEPSPADMEAALLDATVVDDATLRDLANRRGQGVKDALAAKGIAGERLFLVAPRLGTETGGVKPTGEVSGAPSRVDLALR